jgi:transposase
VQKAELAKIVEIGPDREADGVVRWRRIDLKQVIAERFGVDYCERYIGTLLRKLGFSHISARPHHPAQDAETVAAYKNLCLHTERAHLPDLPKGSPIEIWFQDEARIG